MWREECVKMMNSYYEMCSHLIKKKDYEGLEIFFNHPIRFTTEDGDMYIGFDDDMRNMINKILSVGDITAKKFILINGLNNKMGFYYMDLLYICLNNKKYFTLMIMVLCKSNKNPCLEHLRQMCCGLSASADCINAEQRWLRTFEVRTPQIKSSINARIEDIATDCLSDNTLDFHIMLHIINLGYLLLNEYYREPPIKYMHRHYMIYL